MLYRMFFSIIFFFVFIFPFQAFSAPTYEDLSELQYFDFAKTPQLPKFCCVKCAPDTLEPRCKQTEPENKLKPAPDTLEPRCKQTESENKLKPAPDTLEPPKKALFSPNHHLSFTPTISGATGFLTVPVAFVNLGLSFSQNTEIFPFSGEDTNGGEGGGKESRAATKKDPINLSFSLNYGFHMIEFFVSYHMLNTFHRPTTKADEEGSEKLDNSMANIGFKIRLYESPDQLFATSTIINFVPYIGAGLTPDGKSGGLAVQTLLSASIQIYGLTISGVFGKSFGSYEENTNFSSWNFGFALGLRIIDSKYFSMTFVTELSNYDMRGLGLRNPPAVEEGEEPASLPMNLNAILQLGFFWNIFTIEAGVTNLLADKMNVMIQPAITLYF